MKTSKRFNFNDFPCSSQEVAKVEKQIQKVKPTKGHNFNKVYAESSPKQKFSPINNLTSSISPSSPPDQSFQVTTIVSAHSVTMEDGQKGNLELDTIDTNLPQSQQQKKEEVIVEIDENKDFNEYEWMFQEKPLRYLNGVQSQFFQSKQCKRLVSFLSFREKIERNIPSSMDNKERIKLNESKYLGISEWVCEQLKQSTIKETVLQKYKFSEPLYHYLINNVQGYVRFLMNIDKTKEAYIVSMLQSKNFNELSHEILTNFKNQSNILQCQDVRVFKKSLWMVDLGIVAKFYRQQTLQYHGQMIYNKYQTQKESACELLALKLHCERAQRARNQVTERNIRYLMRWALEQKSQQVPILYYLLKSYRNKYSQCFQELTTSILKKIVCPKLFLKILQFSDIPIDKIENCLKIYTNQNPSYRSNSQIQANFAKYIEQKSQGKSKYASYAKHLKPWAINGKLAQYFNKNDNKAFLDCLINNFEKLSKSKLICLEETLQKMNQVITSFRVACTYKQQKIQQYYRSLHELSKLMVNENEKYLQIIRGCKAFIEIKRGIFVIRDESKIKSLAFLYQYLKQQQKRYIDSSLQKSNQINSFLKSIQESLAKVLKTRDGELYLRFLLKNVMSSKNKDVVQELSKSTKSFMQREKVSNSFRDNNSEQVWQRIKSIIQPHSEIHKRLLLLQFQWKSG